MDETPFVGVHGTELVGLSQLLDLLGRQDGDLRYLLLQTVARRSTHVSVRAIKMNDSEINLFGFIAVTRSTGSGRLHQLF